MQAFIEAVDTRVLVCDGAMGTMLYAKGVFINRSFDALNLSEPELVTAVHREYVHTAADGRRYFLLHGDEFDVVTKYHKWLAILGDHTYAFLVRLNMVLSWVRRSLGIAGYWSLASYAKHKVKTAVSFISDFEECVVRSVKDRGLDGVICGHIHSAAIKPIDGVVYINCGDWVDSCTAIVEHFDGRMELVHWGAPGPPAAQTANRAVQAEPQLAD